jgi:hypothetical protein
VSYIARRQDFPGLDWVSRFADENTVHHDIITG